MAKKPNIQGGATAPLSFEGELDEFMSSLGNLLSDAKPRPVVTPHGKRRVTGNLPALKAIEDARFDSSLERSCLLVLSTARKTRWFATHPVVLKLCDANGAWTYTPDAVASMRGEGSTEPACVVCEFRATKWLEKDSARDRVVANGCELRRHGHEFLLMTDRDLPDELVDEIRLLLRARPLAHRWLRDLDVDAWDPTGRSEPDAETARRWAAAQAECDALLCRVMRRDPDSLMSDLATA